MMMMKLPVPAVLGASPCCLCYPLGWCYFIVFGVVVWQAGNEGRWAHVGLVRGATTVVMLLLMVVVVMMMMMIVTR
jgi:hypothetical protein